MPVSCYCYFSFYLALRTAAKFQGVWDDLQKVQEVFIIIAEALAKHQTADNIGHGAAQEEGWIKGFS